ncbi:MAG: hypothetical protein Q9201_005569 [Fulgogasparrea decipioides]
MDLTDFQDASSVQNLLRVLQELDIHRLDSGARYPPLNPGKAEELLGKTIELSRDFTIDTKVYTDTRTNGSGDLTKAAIAQSITASLQRLKAVDGVRPLAAGFLTAKLINNEHEGTRFADNNPLGKAAQGLFGAEDLRAAMKRFDIQLKSYNISPIEVGIRWIAHHSVLGDEDGIIIGASKVEQIRQTVSMIRNGPLPGEVLKAAESFWEAVRDSRSEII